MSSFNIPSWLTRNPLGIVALFISLIYGMSALLLGMSIKNLLFESQIALVAFIVIFPVMILCVFAWLVSCHHTKLYGPSDFRSDSGFLDAGRSVAAELLGKRLEKEIETEESAELDVQVQDPQFAVPLPEDKINRAIFSSHIAKSLRLNQAYVAEGLVFQALQAELSGSIRREVSVGGRHIDGLIYQPNGKVAVVEIKLVRDQRNIPDLFYMATKSFDGLKPNLEHEGIRDFEFLFAVVVDGNPARISQIKAAAAKRSFEFKTYVFGLDDLMRRFGFADKNGSD